MFVDWQQYESYYKSKCPPLEILKAIAEKFPVDNKGRIEVPRRNKIEYKKIKKNCHEHQYSYYGE
jgi:hypothetical protein